jgi:hypothetical protein
MATVVARDLLKKSIASPTVSRQICVAQFFQDISATGLLAADILEIGILPAGCKPHRVELLTAGIDATATLDVGFLTGRVGDTVNARTMNATGELLEAAAKNSAVAAGPGAFYSIAASNVDRGIGVRISADETAQAGETILVTLEYYAD